MPRYTAFIDGEAGAYGVTFLDRPASSSWAGAWTTPWYTPKKRPKLCDRDRARRHASWQNPSATEIVPAPVLLIR